MLEERERESEMEKKPNYELEVILKVFVPFGWLRARCVGHFTVSRHSLDGWSNLVQIIFGKFDYLKLSMHMSHNANSWQF